MFVKRLNGKFQLMAKNYTNIKRGLTHRKSQKKKNSLAVQGDFCKNIDVGLTELCFLGVQM